MSQHQSNEPTPHPTRVRAIAYELAVKETCGVGGTESAVKKAKEIEKYLWGAFEPIERPPTPLGTIEETLDHALQQLVELAANMGDRQKSIAVHECSAQIRRVIADITMVLS